ncbi:hypothetical protein [Halobacteriovorax sp.]|uniref:hypothetical protein n=1 Tax=Halobacteriovorax sp. TaxID=2020862 RepID=UPI0035674106
MSKLVKVAGVYDKRTIQRLKEVGVDQFSFDFRARSFNFLQQHSFMNLQKELALDENMFLHFENEADFVIHKIIDDLKTERNIKNVTLEFSDLNSIDFYEAFKTPFIWHYNLDYKEFDALNKSQYLQGIVLKFSDLLKLHEDGVLHNFCNNFHSLFIDLLSKEDFKLTLELDWDSNLFSSISEFFDFDLISIPISNKVEICYRNVDLSKVQDHVQYLKDLNI